MAKPVTYATATKTFEREFSDLRSDTAVAHYSLPTLDETLRGIRRGKLTVVSGYPSLGKTTLINQIKVDLASQGVTVVFVTYETSNAELLAKTLAMLSNGRLDQADVAKEGDPDIDRALSGAKERYLEISDRIIPVDCNPTVQELSVLVSKVKANTGGDVALICDYLQVMPPVTPNTNDERTRLREIVLALRNIAAKHQVPVFAVSTIARTSYTKEFADLDCLAGAQAIEYSADVVLHLTSKGKGKERITDLAKNERPVNALVLKNKCGLAGMVGLMFDSPHSVFTER